MLAIAIGAVYIYASRIPYLDEWNAIVPTMTGQHPVTLAWLWSPHNEHRIFLPRLISLGLLKLSGGDFKIGSYINVALLALASAGAIWATRKIRGTTAFTDAIFPLLLLHLRHFENIFMMFQIQVILPIVCSVFVLFASASYTLETDSWLLVGCGIALFLMPLCGAYGLPIAFLSSLWLACVAGFRCRRNPTDSQSLAALLLATATVALCVAYLIGLTRSEPEHSTLAEKAGFVINLLRFSMGISETPWLSVIQKSILLFVPIAICLLAWRWLRAAADRTRTAGIAAFFVGALALLGAIASGRNLHVFPSRYFLHTALTPMVLYVIFLLAETDARSLLLGRRFLTTLLFAGVFLISVTSIAPLWKITADSMANRLSFESGMASQVPLPKLLAAYGDSLFFSREYVYHKALDLSQARSGAFRDYRPDAEFLAEPFTLTPTTLQATCFDGTSQQQTAYPIFWQKGAATIAHSPNGIIRLSVPAGNPGARVVRGIRLNYVMDADENLRAVTGFNLRWTRAGDGAQISETEFLDSVWHPRDNPLTLYVDDKIDTISISPCGPFRNVTISGIDLLLPAGGAK